MEHLPISFLSNPPLPDLVVVVPDERDGRIVNKVIHKPQTNKSYFDGIKFTPETMSLRAKLNLGVPMSQVSLGQVENDPNILYQKALHLSDSINSRLSDFAEMKDVSSPSAAPTPES